MHALIITQRVDENHDILGFTAGWIEALAEHVDRLDVLTAYEGVHDLPANVEVKTFGKDLEYSKPRRILSFERHCVRYAREVDVVFAHMIPNYILGSWSWFRVANVPMVLWYAHGSVSPNLQVAHRLVDRVVTSTPEGFRLESDKVTIVGQGIDTDQFTPGDSVTDRRLFLGVGRVMPVKNFELLIDAMRMLTERDLDVSLRIAGDARGDTEYFASVKEYARDAGVEDQVIFLGSVPHQEIVNEYRKAGAFLNASKTGSLDKTALEAMACGTPTISSNDSYVSMVEQTDLDSDLLTYSEDGAEALADRVETLLALTDEEYRELGDCSRQIVQSQHSVDALMRSISDILRDVAVDKLS